MRHLILLGWLLGCFASGFAQEKVSLRDEPDLQKPMTLRAKFLPLRELIRTVAEQTSVRLGIDKTYEQEKVTLFVKERPIWEVLERVAEVTDLKWHSAQSGGYFLGRSQRRAEQEQAFREAQTQNIRDIESRIRELQKSAQSDYSNHLRRVEQLTAQRETIERNKPAGWQDQLSAMAQELYEVESSTDLAKYLLGWWSTQWGREQWRSFWAGNTLIAHYPEKRPFASLPPKVMDWFAQSRAWEQKSLQAHLSRQEEPMSLSDVPQQEPPNRIALIVRYDPVQGDVRCAIFSENSFGSSWSATHLGDSLSSLLGEVPSQFANLPEPLAQTPLRKVVGKVERPYLGERYTLAEVLEWLAQRCDVPIVAQAFRVAYSDPQERFASASSLEEWAKRVLEQQAYLVEARGDYLLVRYRYALLLRLQEVPEPTLQAFEKRVESDGALSLDDYAELASQLSAQQEPFFTPRYFGTVRVVPAVRFDVQPLDSALPAFRFWASLTRTQREQALEAMPLSFFQMTPVQQRLFLDAVDATFSDLAGNAFDLIVRVYDPEQNAKLAFFLDRWQDEEWQIDTENGYIITSSEERALQYLREGLAKQPASLQRYEAKNWKFLFGFNQNEAVSYSAVFRKAMPSSASSSR